MKKFLFPMLLSFFFLFLFIQFHCATEEKKAEPTKAEMISKGKYLVNLGGCNDCHTPKILTPQGPIPDTTKTLSGHPANVMLANVDLNMVGPGKWTLTNDHLTAWVGPWGISYAANLTPDKETGIGTLSEEMFIKTLKEGKMMGVGRPILPPMPWQAIGQISDEDLKAIYAYLQSLKPVNNHVPDPLTPDKVKGLVAKK